MIWLYPLYLLGAVAVIGPILMHLRRRPPQERVEFSSLMFLEVQTPMPVSKRRLEHWLLLLLRCLALLLLALMFSRPLWRSNEEQAIGQGEAVVLLLDRSASMRRGDLWPQAVAAAQTRLSQTATGNRIAVGIFDREVQSLWTFTEDRESASSRAATIGQRLAKIQPGWAATDLGSALVQASQWLANEPGLTGFKKRLVLLTDFQEGSHLEALRGQVWPENVTVEVHSLTVPHATQNLAVSLAAASPESDADSGKNASTDSKENSSSQTRKIRLRFSSAREAEAMDFGLAWEAGGADTLQAHLPGGATRVITAPPVADPNVARVLKLSGDAWDFDNRVFIAPPQPRPVKVVFIGDEKTRQEAASPLYYLSRALQKTATLSPDLQVLPPGKELPKDTDVVFVSGVVLSEVQARELRAFTESGGMLVHVLQEETSPAVLAALTSMPATALSFQGKADTTTSTSPRQDYLMLGHVDSTHPLLQPFADDRLRDFTKLRFWKHRSLEISPEAEGNIQVIARFDDGSPAMLAEAPGKGTLLILTSGWHPADSQLALSTKFVPMLYGWLEAAGFRNEEAASLLVGDMLPAEAGATLFSPDNKALPDGPHRAESIGHYTLRQPTGESRVLAVNLPPEETRLMPMNLERLRELGVKVESNAAGAGRSPSEAAAEKERLAVTEQEGRQRAWLWLLGGLLAILGAETWLAGRIRERRPAATYV